MEYLLLGKINKPHGLKGEVKIFSNTDFAKLRYQKGHVVFVLLNGEYVPLEVHSFYKYKDYDVVSFKDRLDINLVNDLLGKNVYVKKTEATLPTNHYHYTDLVNLKVISENQEIGVIKSIIHAPANDIIRCETSDHKTFDIPFVNEFILKVDLVKKETSKLSSWNNNMDEIIKEYAKEDKRIRFVDNKWEICKSNRGWLVENSVDMKNCLIQTNMLCIGSDKATVPFNEELVNSNSVFYYENNCWNHIHTLEGEITDNLKSFHEYDDKERTVKVLDNDKIY